MNQDLNAEIQTIAKEWAAETEKLLKAEMKKLKVGDKGKGKYALYNSLAHKVYQKVATQIGIDFSFLWYGRLRDMGAGRMPRQTMNENKAAMTGKKQGRKPAKWYSPVFYKQLSSLRGMVGAQVRETVRNTVHSVLMGR